MTITIRASMFTILASATFAVALAHASTPHTRPNLQPRQNRTIQWQPCARAPAPSECALFTVSLDYANPAAGTTQIAMTRFPAQTLPRRGSIFMNPGGPGVSGVDWFADGAPVFQSVVGRDWDVLSFDPRGVGLSGPVLKQFASKDEETNFWKIVMNPGTYEAHGNLTMPKDVGFFLSQASVMDDRLKALDELFIKNNGDNLKYLGSAAVVRDLAAMFDALEGPGSDINLYGYSYGTLLGYWVTQMFPERSGKIILDGVVDPSDWALYPPYLGWDLDIADTEATYKGFTEACAAAGPISCSLAKYSTETAADIDARIEGILSSIYGSWNDTNQYSQNEIAEIIFTYLYQPNTWNDLALFLSQFVNTETVARKAVNVRRPLNILHTSPIMRALPFIKTDESVFPQPDNDPLGGADFGAYEMNDYSIVAIFCGDSADPSKATTKDVFNEIVRVSQVVSHKFGATFNARFFCHRWSSRAVERYQGPFNKKPKNAVLVIGNQADPITPFRSAKLVASQQYLGNSARLIQQWDFGHTSSAEFSNCTISTIANYMRGSLPNESDTDGQFVICPTNQPVLGNSLQRHWDPMTSQDGDGRSSGPGSPGFDDVGKDPYAADEAAFNDNTNGKSNGKSATPRSASIPGFVGFALSSLAAALVCTL